MDIDNLSYFLTGVLFGYVARVVGLVIHVLEVFVLRFISSKNA